MKFNYIFFVFLLAGSLAGSAASTHPAASLCAKGLTGFIDVNRLPRVLHVSSGRSRMALPQRFKAIGQVSVIVPVYRELNNGNIQRLLRNLNSQILNPQLLQVVFVVNNSPWLAEKKDPIWFENQKTLRFLAQAKEKLPFTVHVLDFSTTGIETNMGVIRDIGVRHALQASQIPPDSHVVFNMDADTTFSPWYLQTVINYYENFDLDAVFSSIEFEIRDLNESYLFRTFYRNYHLGFFNLKQTNAGATGVGTPQITFRASAYDESGGFPLIPSDEDFGFTYRLGKLRWVFVPDAVVKTEDRARSDGFDA